MRTWLTERFGLTVPVVAAPMAGVSTGRPAAAVSETGGLGMLGWGRRRRRTGCVGSALSRGRRAGSVSG